MSYESIIGLEVHLQLKTKSKLFCGCSTDFGAPQNSHACPVCLGFPGSLPVLNREALKLSIRTALALNCKISNNTRFDRKNYFYPDLPKAYQISQFNQPLSQNGFLTIWTNETRKRITIRRIHLEEDTGKLFHGKEFSLIDFNRSGTPLLEIVTEPQIDSPDEAYQYLMDIKSIIEYLDVSDCNMEEGSLRCDANISIRNKGSKELGVKIELKNMNSFKSVKSGLEYEQNRQIELLSAGKRLIQETRLYDASNDKTEPMRSKEEAHDYRYFPEPDLVPFDFEESFLKDIASQIPELPEPRKNRFKSAYKLSEYDASIMISDKKMADYFEQAVSLYKKPKEIANWLMGDILSYMKEQNITIDNLDLKVEHLTGMLRLIDEGMISGKIAKTILPEIIRTGKDPYVLVKEKGLAQLSDDKTIENAVEEVLSENTKSVDDFKSGKEKAIMFLVGKVMAKTRGKANPSKVNEILRQKLKGEL